MALSRPSLLSPRSVHILNPIFLSKHTRTVKVRHWTFNHFHPRFLASGATSKEGVFTSPEKAKTFDFTAEERIYNWWESQGYFKPNLDNGDNPFVISMPHPNVTGSLHMGHAMFVTLEDIMVRVHRMKGKRKTYVMDSWN